MRVILNDKLLKNLNYNGITTASKIFDDISKDSDKRKLFLSLKKLILKIHMRYEKTEKEF